MGRSLRSNNGVVLGNLITGSITANGLLSPLAGSENIIQYETISETTTLEDRDGSYLLLADSSFTITLPENSSNGRLIQIVIDGNITENNITLARNGNTINGNESDVILNQSFSFFLIYQNSDWLVKFYK